MGTPSTAPSMLDLIRLSPRLLFPPGGEELYRQIALLSDMGEGVEVLDVACGPAVALEYFVREYGVQGSGVDVDPALIEAAEARARKAELSDRLQFQTAPSDSLPYRDDVFDVSVGEIALAAHCDPGDALRELVRVTRPGGFVVLVQLVWKAPVDPDRRRVLSAHLGSRPLMLVEWKRLLRELGVVDLHTEDWSDEETAFRAKVVKPFPDFAEVFSFWEKLGIMRRARRRWGWSGVRTVLEREWEVHRLLTRERVLGLDLLMGRVAGAEEAHEVREEQADEGSTASRADVDRAPDTEPDPGNPSAVTAGLPLFTDEPS